MDKSRQQFEGWINKNHPKCSGYHKDIRFEAWQASRDSLLLDLPAREKNKGNYDFSLMDIIVEYQHVKFHY
ncbi:hypothetical protein MC862_003833 [Proteus mirabilis]|nr:hypothetical protein [Proteus mirabilis]